MTSERFHKAAKDNIIEVLKGASRKDCNTRDDSGMTPTLWAAFEGHIEALRLLVAKGGDPEKADYFGNTALHLSSARGHMFCVRFLVKFGCNIWSLDVDRHSARELAAINGHESILEFLDFAQTHQELKYRKQTKFLKEKAEKEYKKRIKEYIKRQKVIESRAEKEQKKFLKERSRTSDNGDPYNFIRPTSVPTYKDRLKPSPTFSDIVGTATTRRPGGAVGKKVLARRAVDDFKVVKIEVDGKKSVRSLQGLRRDNEVMYVGTYDSNTMIDTNRSIFQSSQNLHQPQHQEQQQPMVLRRGKITDVWGSLNKAKSTPDLLGDSRLKEEEEGDDNDYEDDDEEDEENDDRSSVIEQKLQCRKSALQLQEPASIFNRPGFGSVAFRRSIATTLDNLPVTRVEIHRPQNGEHVNSNNSSNGNNTLTKNGLSNNNNNGNIMNNNNGHNNGSSNGHNEEISIGSAGSLTRRQNMWDDDLLSEDEADEEWTPLQRFLVANNLSSIHTTLEAEQIDLEALMLLTESDVAALKLPLGPRRKLLHAIASRKRVLESQGTVMKDIKL